MSSKEVVDELDYGYHICKMVTYYDVSDAIEHTSKIMIDRMMWSPVEDVIDPIIDQIHDSVGDRYGLFNG